MSSNAWKHGHAAIQTPEYNSWLCMIQRCTNPNHRVFGAYGGRGIKICDKWRRSFSDFLHDMGYRPIGHTLDRINNDGNYEPGNCRWATRAEQDSNRQFQKCTHCVTCGKTQGPFRRDLCGCCYQRSWKAQRRIRAKYLEMKETE